MFIAKVLIITSIIAATFASAIVNQTCLVCPKSTCQAIKGMPLMTCSPDKECKVNSVTQELRFCKCPVAQCVPKPTCPKIFFIKCPAPAPAKEGQKCTVSKPAPWDCTCPKTTCVPCPKLNCSNVMAPCVEYGCPGKYEGEMCVINKYKYGVCACQTARCVWPKI